MIAIPFRSRFPAQGGRLDWKNDAFDALDRPGRASLGHPDPLQDVPGC